MGKSSLEGEVSVIGTSSLGETSEGETETGDWEFSVVDCSVSIFQRVFKSRMNQAIREIIQIQKMSCIDRKQIKNGKEIHEKEKVF